MRLRETGCILDSLKLLRCERYSSSTQIQSRTALTSRRAQKELIKCLLLYLCILISLESSQSIKLRTHTNCNHHQPSPSSRESHNENNNNNNNQAQLSTPDDYKQFKQKLTLTPEREAKSCTDCLAIPLVAIVGNKQLSGFLIPPQKTQPKLRQYQSDYENAYYEPLRPSISQLEPKSDEKCPMIGPLTVCDQINSYPADIILNKLNNAKKVLKQTYFNIDSLFSDERDHSSEPFDEQTVKVDDKNKGLQRLEMNSSLAKEDHHRMIVESGLSSYNVNINRARNYNHEDPSYWNRMNLFAKRRQNRDASNDDFVRLVEEQGISINKDTLNSRSVSWKPEKEGQLSWPSESKYNRRRSSKSRLSKRQVSVQVSSGQPDPESAASDEQTRPMPVCRAKSIYISPRAALNDKKQWKYVVNAPERDPQIRQIIRVDICEDPFGPCSDQVSIPFGFTSQCKQKYSKKKLLALDAQSGLLEVDTFFIPSCCVCQIIRDIQPLESPNENDTEIEPTN